MASKLLREFEDLNPLNRISVIGTMKQQAFMLCDFNQSVQIGLAKIQTIDDFDGCPSYQNALELSLT